MPDHPPSRKAILQARKREGVFLPSQLHHELETLEQEEIGRRRSTGFRKKELSKLAWHDRTSDPLLWLFESLGHP